MMEPSAALKYQQATDRIRASIEAGMSVGTRLPNERSLAEEFNVSRLTIRRALAELQSVGLVKRVQGAGTFVDGPRIQRGPTIQSFTDSIRAAGLAATSNILATTERAATVSESRKLDIAPGDPVIEIERVRLADGEPMCFEQVVLPMARVPNLGQFNLEGSLYEILNREFGYVVSHVEQEMTATALDAREARTLKCAPHSPAFAVHHIAYTGDHVPIEISESLYRGDRYSVRVEIDLPRHAEPSDT